MRRLTAPLMVPDYTPYAGSPASTTLPAGTYWVPMAQAQKHWVQAMLNEDTYTPFPYFYDVTAWSQPLLFNVAGGRSGAQLAPSSQVVPALPAPAEPALPADAPTVAVWQMSTGTGAIESSGWLRWLLDKKWQLPHDDVTAADIATGALAGTDVLVVPDGDAAAGEKALGKKGVQVLRDWVAGGGRLVGLSEGAVLAGRLGVTGATFASPTSDIPGSLVRASVGSGPLAAGVGGTVWNFVEYDPVLRAADPASVAVSYQPATFAVSGFAEGEDELVGTAAVTDEGYGAGRVVLFASDPNFRAFTDGTQKVLRNALRRVLTRPRLGRRQRRRPGSGGERGGRRSRTSATRCWSRFGPVRPARPVELLTDHGLSASTDQSWARTCGCGWPASAAPTRTRCRARWSAS